MEKEFIPYEQALEIKELGFDEPCFGYRDGCGYLMIKPTSHCVISAPTFSQAFRFFREKYQMNANIDWNFYAELMNRLPDKNFYYVVKNKIGNNKILSESFETYEEAELACIRKLIELAKEKNIEKEEITYPIYCKLKDSSLVVKFTDLTAGEVVVNSKCYKTKGTVTDFKECTDTSIWQQLNVCEKTGFFDGQLVWCWDNVNTHVRQLRFYDVKYKCTYTVVGDKNGGEYENYKPFEGNYPDWALEAFKTL